MDNNNSNIVILLVAVEEYFKTIPKLPNNLNNFIKNN